MKIKACPFCGCRDRRVRIRRMGGKGYRITPESLRRIGDVFIKSNLELIWERKEPKKMTVEEMRQKLEELTGEEIEVTA